MYELPDIPPRKTPRQPYRKPDSVKELERLANIQAREQHPNIDPRFLAPRTYRDDKANCLTSCVVKYIELMGGWASRVNTTGIYDAKLKRYRTSTQKRGIADVIATYRGLSLQIEIKIGRDRMSDDQMKVQSQVEKAGGRFFVAHDFTEFKQWFDAIN